MTSDAEAPAEPVTRAQRRRQGGRRGGWVFLRDVLVIILIAVVVSALVKTFLVRSFYIPSGSMEPTLMVGDRIVVDKLAVDWGTVNRGDVVVFHAPPTENCGAAVSDLVKRVVGLPGDTVSSDNNTILINGQPLAERWPHTEPLGTPIRTFKVPEIGRAHV